MYSGVITFARFVWTYGRTDGQRDEQSENIMPPAPYCGWRHKNAVVLAELLFPETILLGTTYSRTKSPRTMTPLQPVVLGPTSQGDY